MELINNITKTLKDDLAIEIRRGSRLSIAAACFSIYAFQELKAELQMIDELRLFLHHQLLLRKKLKRKSGNFIFRGLTANVAFMEQSLRLN